MYSSWAECEEELQRPLEGVAGCVATCCRALEDQSESMSQDFLPVLREYVLYIESMKVSALRVRRHAWKENDFTTKNITVSNNKQVSVKKCSHPHFHPVTQNTGSASICHDLAGP